MKKLIPVVFAALLLLPSGFAQKTADAGFDQPWNDFSKPLILDPFWQNHLNWDALAAELRVKGIIHKATECGRKCFADRHYLSRKLEGKNRQYLWGSYHLGRPGIKPELQADFYLAQAKPSDDEIIALDIEGLDAKKDMSLGNAERFIKRIKERTGRYPLLYTTGIVVHKIVSSLPPDSIFTKTPIWYARYCDNISCYFPNKIWKTYTLWQFASEVNCPTKSEVSDKPCDSGRCPLKKCPLNAPIPGTRFDMDVNVFNGTIDELRKQWPFTFKEP
jgi:lysozyme